MTRSLSTASLVRRQLIAASGSVVALGLVIAIGALLLSLAPRAVSSMSSAEATFQVAAQSPNRSFPTATVADPVTGSGASPDLPAALAAVWGRLDADLAEVRQEAGTEVRTVLGPAAYRVTSQAQPLTGPDVTGPSREVVLAADPRIDRLVDILDGAAPRSTSTPNPDQPLDVMLSEQSAQQLSLTVGSVSLMALADGTTQPVRVSGTFRAKHPDAPYWSLNRATLQAEVLDDGNSRPSVTATVYVDAAAYPRIRGIFAVPTARVWYPVRPDVLVAADLPAVSTGLRKFLSVGYQISARPASSSSDRLRTATLSLRSDLPPLLDRVQSRLAATAAVLAIVAAGPLGALLAALVLAGRLVLLRQGRAVAVAAARGASGRQVRVLIGLEGLLAGVVAAVGGVALAAGLVPGVWTPGVVVGPVLLAVLPAVGLTVIASSGYVRDLADAKSRPTFGRRRWLGEVAAVALAAAATFLLLRRGLTSTAGQGVDPLLAGTPLLLSVAWALVLLRVTPYPVSAYARWARRRRDLVPFLGAARVVRERGAGLAPMITMVMGVAIAVASGLLLTTVRDGLNDAARSQVGADLRVTGTAFGPADVGQIRSLPGVRAVAAVFDAGPVTVNVAGTVETAELFVTDSANLAVVQRDVPGAAALPADLTAPGGPVRVVMSKDLAEQSAAADVVNIGVSEVVPVGQANGAAGLDGATTFVLVDAERAAEILDGEVALPQTLLIDADPSASGPPTVTAVRRVLGPGTTVQTPGAQATAFRAAPVVTGLVDVLVVAVGSVAVLLAIGVLLSSMLAARPRHRLLGVLRVLGIDRRASGQVIAWEFGPAALTSVVGGSLLGVGLVFLVRATVDLRPFTGGNAQPGFGSVWPVLGATTAGFLLVLGLAVVLAGRLDRRAGLRTALRLGEEE